MISKHGVPTEFVSDRDVRFTSSFWESFTSFLNTKLSMSTAFHPQDTTSAMLRMIGVLISSWLPLQSIMLRMNLFNLLLSF